MNDKYLYWIWLNGIKGVGPAVAKKLIEKFISPENIYNAGKKEIQALAGVGDKLSENIIEARNLDNAKKLLYKCEKENINIVNYKEEKFPSIINNYSVMPVLLYYRGNLYNNISGVAIVGARRCSEYAKQVTVEASSFLAENKIPVISGMAKGIDGYAHTACLKGNGYTAAFLGCGVDICYPNEHIELMEKIIEKGVVISEYPPGITPKPEYFPKRNRLISACSQKVLVVEAGENSGALITANYAKKQNKEIFAVPNNIYLKESSGANKLISEGASIYLNPKQLLLNNVGNYSMNNQEIKNKDDTLINEEKDILAIIKNKPCTIDEIIISLKKDKSIILQTLFSMELEEKVKCIAGRYVL